MGLIRPGEFHLCVTYRPAVHALVEGEGGFDVSRRRENHLVAARGAQGILKHVESRPVHVQRVELR